MCMIDSINEPCSVYRVSHHKARKQHWCYECRRAIYPGELYRYTFLVHDGASSLSHTCSHCIVACDWLSTHCGGFLSGGVLEDITDHIEASLFEGRRTESTKLARLTVGMRRGWQSFKDPEQLLAIPKSF